MPSALPRSHGPTFSVCSGVCGTASAGRVERGRHVARGAGGAEHLARTGDAFVEDVLLGQPLVDVEQEGQGHALGGVEPPAGGRRDVLDRTHGEAGIVVQVVVLVVGGLRHRGRCGQQHGGEGKGNGRFHRDSPWVGCRAIRGSLAPGLRRRSGLGRQPRGHLRRDQVGAVARGRVGQRAEEGDQRRHLVVRPAARARSRSRRRSGHAGRASAARTCRGRRRPGRGPG